MLGLLYLGLMHSGKRDEPVQSIELRSCIIVLEFLSRLLDLTQTIKIQIIVRFLIYRSIIGNYLTFYSSLANNVELLVQNSLSSILFCS